jgi:hypothetical protein
MSFCTNCGFQLIPDSLFCSGCGEKVTNEVEAPLITPPTTPYNESFDFTVDGDFNLMMKKSNGEQICIATNVKWGGDPDLSEWESHANTMPAYYYNGNVYYIKERQQFNMRITNICRYDLAVSVEYVMSRDEENPYCLAQSGANLYYYNNERNVLMGFNIDNGTHLCVFQPPKESNLIVPIGFDEYGYLFRGEKARVFSKNTSLGNYRLRFDNHMTQNI